MVCFVGAAAVITGSSNSKIIIACYGWNSPFPDLADHFIWPDIITNQVAQAIDKIGLSAVYILEKPFKRRQVGVNIAEQSNFTHECSFCSLFDLADKYFQTGIDKAAP